jgi:hypothetical protein
MKTTRGFSAFVSLFLLLFLSAAPLAAQFRDDFEVGALRKDPEAIQGWAFRTGDGAATIDLLPGAGFASAVVDATNDRRNIWWAIIRRCVSAKMDLARLSQPGWELRVEARIRVSDAPRRVNLHFNTPRTTNFHSHLMEYDIPEAGKWYTISMTTREFDAVPGDRVFAQMALMDWGVGRYRVDVDYVRADVVELANTSPDLGEPLPYRPPLADPKSFHHAVTVAHDATIDHEYPEMNFNRWSTADGSDVTTTLLNVSGSRWTILRWDLAAFRGRTAAGSGLLELTSYGVERLSEEIKDFGEVRVVEILAGDPTWDQTTVTQDSLRRGELLETVINPQTIIDLPIAPNRGAKTLVTLSRPVLQRLLDGRTRGLAIRPLGAVHASLFAMENADSSGAARLLFKVRD